MANMPAEYFRNRRKERYPTIRKMIDSQKLESGCVSCGYNKCPAALQFDHINPEEKKFAVGRMAFSNYSLETIQAEIDKCRVLCANCHAEYTHGYWEGGRNSAWKY